MPRNLNPNGGLENVLLHQVEGVGLELSHIMAHAAFRANVVRGARLGKNQYRS
jgi:hypothetical protein